MKHITGTALRIHRQAKAEFSIDGTPTDCVLVAFHGLLEEKPDLVVSGINHGPNMGEDVFYSGTVAAAIEGSMQGVNNTAHFAGEHTSVDFQGYLQGGVETGERAANEILAAIKKA